MIEWFLRTIAIITAGSKPIRSFTVNINVPWVVKDNPSMLAPLTGDWPEELGDKKQIIPEIESDGEEELKSKEKGFFACNKYWLFGAVTTSVLTIIRDSWSDSGWYLPVHQGRPQ